MSVDTRNVQAYLETLKSKAPSVLADVKRVGLLRIGEYDIKTLRATGLVKLKIRSKGAPKAFKFQLNDENTLSEFSKWKGAGQLAKGGNARSRGRMQLLWTDAGRKPNGRRKYSEAQIDAEITSGKMQFIKRTGRTTILVRHYGKQNKKGNWSVGRGSGTKGSGSRMEIIAFVKRVTVHRGGWFDLAANSQKNAQQHEKIASATLDQFVNKSPLVDHK